MKGIILAGGKGTRLYPLTKSTNKHLLPVGKEPMIWHPIKQLVLSGITEILIVTSINHLGDIVNSLGSGKSFSCELTYRVQEEANGIAHALLLAEKFAQGDRIVVILGDNIFEYSITQYIEAFQKQDQGARILLKEVDSPERFGIAVLVEKRIVCIEEKPVWPKSNYAIVGCYMYDDQVFDLIKQIQPSARGELEITSINNIYLKKGQLEYSFVKGKWLDAGTFESLNEANTLLLNNGNEILF